MVKLVSGSSEPVVLENGARYLVWNAPFYAVLGMLLSTRYALQSMGEKVLPLLSSVIEFLGKIVFVLLFIPRFEYKRGHPLRAGHLVLHDPRTAYRIPA